MGVPDPAFYTMVVITTLGLIFLYFKPLWEKAAEGIRTFLGIAQSKYRGSLQNSTNNTSGSNVYRA